MFRRLYTLGVALLFSCTMAVGAAQANDLQDIISSGKVRIGVPIDVPPFGFMDADNQPAGLDVDVANMIGEALGVEVELQQITGANRVPYLVTNRLDIVISSLGATPERAQQIAFTSPYSAIAIGVFGPSTIKVTSPEELGSYSIAVARGTTPDLDLTAVAPNANIQRFDDDATAVAAYLSGQTDLLGTGNMIARDVADKNPDVELDSKFVLRYSPTHIGIQQGKPELLRWLDTFVFYNHLVGNLSNVTEKWLGQPLPQHFPSL